MSYILISTAAFLVSGLTLYSGFGLGALLMPVFALFEFLPTLRSLKFDRKYLFHGGVLSGFFGGLSGHQGALRSAFLVKVGVSTEAFVGTNAMIGFMVDMTRIATYAVIFLLSRTANPIPAGEWPLILAGICHRKLKNVPYLPYAFLMAIHRENLHRTDTQAIIMQINQGPYCVFSGDRSVICYRREDGGLLQSTKRSTWDVPYAHA